MKKRTYTIVLLFSLLVIHKVYNIKNEVFEHYHRSKISIIDLINLAPKNPYIFEFQPISIINIKIPKEVRNNIEALKARLKILIYNGSEKKCYEHKNLSELYRTLESTNKNDEILKSIDQILLRVYSQIDTLTSNKTSYFLFKGPLKKRRENSIQQKMELIFINAMVCASEIYKRMNSGLQLYPIKLMGSVLFQKPSSIPFSISYAQIAKNNTCNLVIKDNSDENLKKLELIQVNTSINKNWKIFLSKLKNDKEAIAILSKYNSMGIIKYWAATSFKKEWEKNKENTQKIISNLKSEFYKSKELFNELFYKQHIVSSTIPTHNDNKKLKYQMKIMKKQIVPFFSHSHVSPGKKEKTSQMASYDFKNTFNRLPLIGKLATLNILNETTDTLEKFANLDNKKIREESIENLGNLYAHLSRLLEKNEPKKTRKKRSVSKPIVFNSEKEAKEKITELTNTIMKINNL